MTMNTEKRRTRIQAAAAGVALTALMGGLLAVDVAQRPERVQVPFPPYAEEWEKLKRDAVDEGWTQEQLQEAKDAARMDACSVDLRDHPVPEVEAQRRAEKVAAGCDPERMGFII